ncbi:sodium-coupled monocarboxylate transporter 2-like [Bradysia coprophila]|uniref:sodium-coupled monocarboxylate transporter 2-like n=1 Tax=Bradysia coprophila TaxID=38358 RepID=UPI00187D95ED|nr:sodium-coupled monocarboxylate transporter 2-like [Bradysia coprophila]
MAQSNDSASDILSAVVNGENATVSNSLNSQRLAMQFSTIDYVLFVGMLLLSSLIGIYYGFLAKTKQNTVNEYLLGGKTMHIVPIAMSLIASHISGSTLLGVPVEIYTHGTQYWMFIMPALVVAVSMIYVYLPVFHDLQLTSCYAYLEKRFDKNVKMMASTVYAVQNILFIPIVMYVPALALSQVSGTSLYIIVPMISAICIFYTTIGGLKAVVMTDALQFVLMIIAILVIICLGMAEAGGWTNIWEAAERGNRLQFFNMDPSPFTRTSFWIVLFGLSTTWVSNLGVSQSCIQKFLAVPNLQKARRSVFIFTVGLIVVKSFCCFTGLVMYAHYETCDPITTKAVEKNDQILPYYVVEVAGSVPGISGLFIAGIFSAALSTMSASLNTVAGTIYEDFLKHRNPNASEKTASNIMKIIVVVLGLVEMCLVFIVEKLGPVFLVTLALNGTTTGALLGMFTMGIIFRKANTKGVLWGTAASVLLLSVIVVGSFSVPSNNSTLPLRTDGCDEDLINGLNITTTAMTTHDEGFWLFRISFMYFSLIGFITVIVVGYPVSLLTADDSILDERLLTPFMRSKEYKEKAKLTDRLFEAEYAQIEQKEFEMKNMEK